jgi:hypothetical protein
VLRSFSRIARSSSVRSPSLVRIENGRSSSASESPWYSSSSSLERGRATPQRIQSRDHVAAVAEGADQQVDPLLLRVGRAHPAREHLHQPAGQLGVARDQFVERSGGQLQQRRGAVRDHVRRARLLVHHRELARHLAGADHAEHAAASHHAQRTLRDDVERVASVALPEQHLLGLQLHGSTAEATSACSLSGRSRNSETAATCGRCSSTDAGWTSRGVPSISSK